LNVSGKLLSVRKDDLLNVIKKNLFLIEFLQEFQSFVILKNGDEICAMMEENKLCYNSLIQSKRKTIQKLGVGGNENIIISTVSGCLNFLICHQVKKD
jgi:hypothetical protein